jgi:hypothetical protein
VASVVDSVLARVLADPIQAVSVCSLIFRTKRPWYLRSLVGLALLVLRVLASRVLLVGGEGNAGEQRHHDDDEDEELHFDW